MKTTMSLSLDEILELRSCLRQIGEEGGHDPENIGETKAAAIERLDKKLERAVTRARRCS